MSNFLCIFASDLEVQMICHFTVGSIVGNAGERPMRNTTVKNTYNKVVMLVALQIHYSEEIHNLVIYIS